MDMYIRLRNNYDWTEISYVESKKTLSWFIHKEIVNYNEAGKINTIFPLKIINRFIKKGWIVEEIDDVPF